MNREINFRGKSISTGKWLYGCLLKNEEGKFAVVKPFKVNMDNECSCCEVDEETIGQFTGLKDKNGKEIYEGDILKFFYIPYYSRYDITLKVYRVGEVAFVNGCFRLVNLTDYDDIDLNTKSELQPCEGSEIEIHSNFCSVIGNIHDNKDLLNEI